MSKLGTPATWRQLRETYRLGDGTSLHHLSFMAWRHPTSNDETITRCENHNSMRCCAIHYGTDGI